jgi:hypothetical protein
MNNNQEITKTSEKVSEKINDKIEKVNEKVSEKINDKIEKVNEKINEKVTEKSNKNDEKNRKKKKKGQTNVKVRTRLTLNATSCPEVAAKLTYLWDKSVDLLPYLSLSPIDPFVLAVTPSASSTLPLSPHSLTPYCPNNITKFLIINTINLVCRIRVVTRPKITMVTLPRCLATAWLTLAALKLPGDIVETGTWRGGMSILSLSLMKSSEDLCDSIAGRSASSRKFWAFDS